MADAENEHYQSILFECANDAVVADTVPPELTESPLQSFANLAGVFEFSDSLVEKPGNTSRDGFIEFVELSLGFWRNLNVPGHSGALLFRGESACCVRNGFLPVPSLRSRRLPGRPDIAGWPPARNRSWCVRCAWRAGRGVFRWSQVGGWLAWIHLAIQL